MRSYALEKLYESGEFNLVARQTPHAVRICWTVQQLKERCQEPSDCQLSLEPLNDQTVCSLVRPAFLFS